MPDIRMTGKDVAFLEGLLDPKMPASIEYRLAAMRIMADLEISWQQAHAKNRLANAIEVLGNKVGSGLDCIGRR